MDHRCDQRAADHPGRYINPVVERHCVALIGVGAVPQHSLPQVLLGKACWLFLFLALADQVLRQIGQRGARQRVERKRAGDVDRGEAEAGGQQAVEHAFAEAL